MIFFIDIEKAREGLVQRKVTVTRSGKTFQQTVWVRPEISKTQVNRAIYNFDRNYRPHFNSVERKGLEKISAKEAISRYQKGVESMMQDCNVNIRLNSKTLSKILEKGEFLNQHEIRHSGGIYDPKFRRQYESAIFGLKKDSPAKRFPIYGYLTSKTGKTGTHNLKQYGNIIVQLKDDVKLRSSFTQGDSHDRKHIAPSLISNPKYYSLDPYKPKILKKLYKGEKASISDEETYFEAQVFGGVSLKDIKSIKLRGEKLSKKDKERLSEFKIEVKE
ncbi:hypothetical protein CCP3SC1AL1_320005 [Gammaproteobacteria bacterium]